MHLVNRYAQEHQDHFICNLCPRSCMIKEGKKGACGTRTVIDGRLYSLTYGRISSMHVDPIEKKPLYHFYPGTEILSIGTLGCNIFCNGCQNYEISRKEAHEQQPVIEPEEVVEKAIEQETRMIAYTYNEPTVFYEFMLDIARIARKNKIKNVMVSNGYISSQPLKVLSRYLDAVNIDLKAYDDRFYREYARATLDPVLKTIKTLYDTQVWLEITNLLIEDLNTSQEQLRALTQWISKNTPNAPLHFSRFFPLYKENRRSVTSEATLDKARRTARTLPYVYVGNTGHTQDTHCHHCGNLLITRGLSVKVVGILDGKCVKCASTIPGRF